ncbi:MAG: hypothetical protein H0U71_01955 [Gammaproteobacteria bacterium]|nr:hypothetical protein [Gammaproteobacteria bacterium]
MKWGHVQLISLLGIIFFSPLHAQYSSDYGTHLDDDLRAYCNRQAAYSTGVSDARKGLARKEDYAQICRVDRALYNSAYNTGYSYGLTNQSGLIVNEPTPNHPDIQDQLPSSYVQPYTRPVVTTNPNIAPVVPNAGSAVVASPGYSSVVAPGVASSNNSQASRTPIYPGEVMVPTGDFAKPEPEHGLQSLIEVGPSPRPKCIETVSGQACGFNCVNSFNNVRCAPTPDQVCRSNDLGEIACGYNCIATAVTVRCAMTPTDVCVSDHNGRVYCGVNCRITDNADAMCDLERYAH